MTVRSLVPWYWGRRGVPVRRVGRDPVSELQRSVDQLFDEFFNGFGSFGLRAFNGESLSVFNPSIDVSETETEIKVAAELPGMGENDIDVSLAHNVLTISGEKKAEKEEKDQNYYRMERSYGSFKRSVTLPTEVDADKVDATFKNGVLTITLPKTAEAQAKKIDVKTS